MDTQPETTKLAPLFLAIKRHSGIECQMCVTGPHQELLDQGLDVFDIGGKEVLNVVRQNLTLGELTSSAVSNLDEFMKRERLDAVLVQGDTAMVFAAAFVVFSHHIPVGHVCARAWQVTDWEALRK